MKIVRVMVIVLLVLSLALTGCGKKQEATSTTSSKTIKIGTILPLTGDAAPLGKLGKDAREMAVEEINNAGGIKSLGGAKLELVFGDSEGKPQVGVSEAERLITQEHVVMLNGAYQSGITLPASEVAERYKIVWLAPVPSDTSITQRGFKYVFRMADTSAMRVTSQIEFMKYMKQEYGTDLKTAAIVYENTSWGQGVAAEWKKQLPSAGIQIVVDEPYDKSAADLTPVVTKVKDGKPDVVLMVSYVSDATLLANGFHQQKVTPKLFIGTSGGYADPEYIRNTGDATLGFFDVSAWEQDVSRPFSKEINDKFVKKYGYPLNGEGVKAYTAMYVIADALERAGSTDSEKLRQAFAETNMKEGPVQMYTKQIHFDKTQTLPDPSLIMVQFQKVNGKVERITVWPKEVARKKTDGTPYEIQLNK